MKATKRQSGVSLIEIMLSTLLGLMLVVVVISVFMSNIMTYNQNGGLARVQEGARIIINSLVSEVSAAGSTPCGFRGNVASLINNGSNYWWSDWGAGLRGYEQGDTLHASLRIGENGIPVQVPGTDAIIFHTSTSEILPIASQVVTNTNQGSFFIDSIHDTGDLKADDLVIVCNFVRTILLQVDSVLPGGELKYRNGGAAPSNCPPDFLNPCAPSPNHTKFLIDTLPNMLGGVSSSFWYVGDNGDGKSLYRMERNKTAGNGPFGPGKDVNVEEVISNLEDFQLEYLRETSPGVLATNYVTANLITDWSSVVTVRMVITFKGNGRDIPDFEWRRTVAVRNMVE